MPANAPVRFSFAIMSSVTSAIKDAILPSDSNKEAELAAQQVPETTPTVADPGLVGRPKDELVTEHTTVYTNATPDVLESSNHHVMTEAVPITHTPVADYNEVPRAAPAILGGDLYSILGQTEPVSSTTAQPVAEQSKETVQPMASNSYVNEVPSNEMAWTIRDTDAYTSAGAGAGAGAGAVAGAGAGAAASHVASTSEAPAAPAGQGSAVDQLEPTTEQAWSVRGPASNLVSKGPHEHAAHLSSDAAGNVPIDESATSPTEKVADAPGAAVSGAQDKVAGAPGQAKDTVAGTASQAKDTTTGTATGATSQAKDAATGTASQAKNTATDAAEKPKKLGLVQKVKKALKIGKQNK